MKFMFRQTLRFDEATPDLTGERIPLPERLTIPLRQHAGGPAALAVETGQEVAAGQVLARPEPDQVDAAPVHAPAPGLVKEVVSLKDFRGQPVQAVVLEVAGEPEAALEEAPAPPAGLDPAALLERVREAGVVAAGPMSWPLALGLGSPRPEVGGEGTEAPPARPCDHFILSALDEEPGLFVQRRLAVRPEPALFEGLKALVEMSGAGKLTVIADKHLDEAAWREVLGWPGASLVRLAGEVMDNCLAETQVHRVTGRQVPLPQGDPGQVGVAFVRLEPAYWAGLALSTGRPQTAKWLTVSPPQGAGRLVEAALGTPVGHVLSSLGIEPREGGKVILGGRLTGWAIYDLDTPVTKEVDGLTVLDPDQVAHFRPEPCFNCGLCVRVCPTWLLPGELSKYCEYNRHEDAEAHDLFHCIECGLCAYVCPARRPMVHYFRHAKEELLARRAGQ